MDWPADVRPASLKQPDPVSCGPTAVVAARMLLEPTWRPADLDAEIARTHRRLTSTHSYRDRFQAPWPRRLGTPPWGGGPAPPTPPPPTVGAPPALVKSFRNLQKVLVTVPADRWRRHRVGVAGWSHLWFVV